MSQRSRPAPDLGHKHPSRVQQTINALRRHIVAAGSDGAFLGSEAELMRLLRVSRPTFRLAACVLVHAKLIEVRQGHAGGSFTRAPSADVVKEITAAYFGTRQVSREQLHQCLAMMGSHAAALIAGNPDRRVRRQLRVFLDNRLKRQPVADANARWQQVQESEAGFDRLCGNPVHHLLLEALRSAVRGPRQARLKLTADRAASYISFYREVAIAFEHGAIEQTRQLTQRHADRVALWLAEDARAATVPSPRATLKAA